MKEQVTELLHRLEDELDSTKLDAADMKGEGYYTQGQLLEAEARGIEAAINVVNFWFNEQQQDTTDEDTAGAHS